MTFQNSFGEIFNVFQKHWDDFLGDCKVPTKHINRRVWHSRIWSLIKFLDVLLRSIGEVRQVTCEKNVNLFIMHFCILQTVFVNNPFCGLLILVSIFIGHTKAGVGCALGGKMLDSLLTISDKMMFSRLHRHLDRPHVGSAPLLDGGLRGQLLQWLAAGHRPPRPLPSCLGQ